MGIQVSEVDTAKEARAIDELDEEGRFGTAG
jgi:hypothetical protein